MKVKYNPDECVIQEDGNLICSENGNELTTSNGTNKLEITMKGNKPSGGTIKLQNGKIIDIIDLYFAGKYANFDENKNIVFSIYAIPTEAGLYDENYNLLATWEETKELLGLDLDENGILYIEDMLEHEESYSCDYDEETYEEICYLDIDILKNAKILVISDEVKTLGNDIFEYCTGLTSITIPTSVTSIGWGAFYGCTDLTSVTFENTEGWYIASSESATSGTSMNVTDTGTNAANLKSGTYTRKYWKRS